MTTPVTPARALPWSLSHRADPMALAVADHHYNRQKPGTPQFVPPGRCFVLRAPGAVWVTSWPFAEYVRHAWPGAWINSCFRREGCEHPRTWIACDHDDGRRPCGCCWFCGLSVGSRPRASDMIRAAVAATRWKWPEVPALGMVTFVDPKKVRPTMVRGVPVWGWSYLKAGFRLIGKTRGGLLAFQMLPHEMPPAMAPRGAQEALL